MLTGLLLAAGRGRRMGGTKQLVPWLQPDGTTQPLIAAAYDAIAPVCDQMIVVLGHEVPAVQAALAPREFQSVVADPDAEMFDSLRVGLASIGADSSVLLQLADHPFVQRTTLELITAAARDNSDMAIVPTFEGRGGHPVLIPPKIVSQIKTVAVNGGLKSFWLQYPATCRRLEINDPSIVEDIDTPTDLRQFGQEK